MAFLTRFAETHRPLSGLSIAYTTDRKEAEELVARLADVFPKDAILLTQIGPALGAHLGPGCLSVALLKSI
jgi:fatty acid-binding protein DegV